MPLVLHQEALTAFESFNESAELQAQVYNDTAVKERRKDLFRTKGQVSLVVCPDRCFCSVPCVHDVVPGWVTPYRTIGAMLHPADKPFQDRFESDLRRGRNHGNPETTLFHFGHTRCIGLKGDDERAERISREFTGQMRYIYRDYYSPDGYRLLLPISGMIDKHTGSWTLINENRRVSGISYRGMNPRVRTARISKDIDWFLEPIERVHPKNRAGVKYLFQQNTEYLDEGVGPLKERSLRNGYIIFAGKGSHWTRSTDNVYSISDQRGERYVQDIRVPIDNEMDEEGNKVDPGLIIAGSMYGINPDEPFRKENAISRAVLMQEQISEMIDALYPRLYRNTPIIPAVFNWDTWQLSYPPEVARGRYHNWEAA